MMPCPAGHRNLLAPQSPSSCPRLHSPFPRRWEGWGGWGDGIRVPQEFGEEKRWRGGEETCGSSWSAKERARGQGGEERNVLMERNGGAASSGDGDSAGTNKWQTVGGGDSRLPPTQPPSGWGGLSVASPSLCCTCPHWPRGSPSRCPPPQLVAGLSAPPLSSWSWHQQFVFSPSPSAGGRTGTPAVRGGP